MNTFRVDVLSDDELLSRTCDLVARGRRVEAALIAHIAEVDARGLYRREACSSMFAYATERLRLSEAQAYERIQVARVSRAFPSVLEMLTDGRLSLTAAARLAPHLNQGNAEVILGRAVHATKREVQMLVVELAPQPDVPSLVRRLPTEAARGGVRPAGVAPAETPQLAYRDGVRPVAAAETPPPTRAVPVPIAPARFKVQFTASAELEAKIGRARALLRHQNPSGDLAAIIDRAMTLLLAQLERQVLAATEKPRKTVRDASPSPSSRRIPAPIRRAVWQRDEGQCSFLDRHGQRCACRERLELHHVVPFGQGGDHSLENLRLLCSAHNRYQAELDYGKAFIAQVVARAQSEPAP